MRRYEAKRTTPDEAIGRIGRGKHIFIGSGAAEPLTLVEALVRQARRFADNSIVHLLTLGPAPYTLPEFEEQFRHNAFFIGPNVRQAVHDGRADYTPVFLSQIPAVIRSRRVPVDVALIQCTPPDAYGFVNLGVSVDVVLAAIESALLVVAEINPNMPVIFGAGFLPMDRIHAWTYSEAPLVERRPEPLDEVALEIGRYVATLVEDGATLQTGIGQIPDATLKALGDKHDLGIWTEMFSDGILDLIESGVITGKFKTIHPRKISSSFAIGSQRLYGFLNCNPMFTFHPSDFINDPQRIARQHRMTAINSALEIDLTGQVCADSIGTKFYSGIGGQVDFVRGSSMAPGGRAIIAMRSTAEKGKTSRIAPILREGAGVVTSRGDVRFVVTEYGMADLWGKSIRERAMNLISIAHPDFRAELLTAAKQRRYVFIDQVAPTAPYPRQMEKPIELKNGRAIHLRPIRVSDEPKLHDLFYSLSDNTLYKRYLRVIKRIPHKEIQYFTDVDYRTNLALVAETVEPAEESQLIGVAQYFLDPATQLAEVAFVVADSWQGHGLGSELIRHLAEVGRENGLAGFTADVLADNRAMLHVFHKSGLAIESRLKEGIYQLKMLFPASDESAPEDEAPLPQRPTGTGF